MYNNLIDIKIMYCYSFDFPLAQASEGQGLLEGIKARTGVRPIRPKN